MTRTGMHGEERRRRMHFVIESAEAAYRVPLTLLYEFWSRHNDRLAGGEMYPPHLGIDHTPPTVAAVCSPSTNYGASMQVTFKAALLIDPSPASVVQPWGEGHGRYLDGLVLRYTLLQ
jgi:hypothetical protein